MYFNSIFKKTPVLKQAFTIIMKNIIFLIICTITMIGCASQKAKFRGNYDISRSFFIKLEAPDSIKVKELRFKPKYSSADLQKYLYDKFGIWNKTIKRTSGLDVLVWENIKPFNSRDELFSIGASGIDVKYKIAEINGYPKYERIFYCSAIVLNSKNIDLFQSSSELKDSLAKFLIMGTKTISKKDYSMDKNVKN